VESCGYYSVFAGTSAALSHGMTSKILALLLLSASLAHAEDRPPVTSSTVTSSVDELQIARSRERDAATRQRINAQLTTIAERDIVTAQIIRDLAERQRDAALRAHRSDDAGRWTQRHQGALRDEREAQDRAARYARERDQARAEFDASAQRVRRLERHASRARAT
jgi:hypothetical protein